MDWERLDWIERLDRPILLEESRKFDCEARNGRRCLRGLYTTTTVERAGASVGWDQSSIHYLD